MRKLIAWAFMYSLDGLGRAAYEGMAGALPTADHPFTGIMNAARKVVFTRLFDDVPKSYRLDLVSSTEFSNGTVGLHYRRHR
jgi:hypothetical protein